MRTPSSTTKGNRSKRPSQNAAKHGLWSRHWQNPEEQSLYEAMFDAYLDDYQPVGATEIGMVEALASCRVRLLRYHKIEEANISLAQSQAVDPQRFLDFYGVDNDSVQKAFAASLYAGFQPSKDKPDQELAKELASIPLHEISGWGYVDASMPLFKSHLLKAAEREQLSLPDLLASKTPALNSLPRKIIITTHQAGGSATVKPDLKTTEVRADALQKYAEYLGFVAGKHFLLMQLLIDFISLRPALVSAAMPSTTELNMMHRAKTAEERLMSKTIGELHEVQRRRRLNERSSTVNRT